MATDLLEQHVNIRAKITTDAHDRLIQHQIALSARKKRKVTQNEALNDLILSKAKA